MKLRTKITYFVAALVAALVAVSFLGMKTLRDASIKDNHDRIEQLMKSTVNIINQFEQFAQTGELSEQQAKALATQILRENKYHPSEYVYVVNENFDFIATPHDPQLHGESFNDFKTADGVSIGQMVKTLVGSTANKSFIYHWTQKVEVDGKFEVIPKTSIVQKTQTWGWYVGNGISNQEADERYWNSAWWSLSFSLVITIILGIALTRFGISLHNALGGEVRHVLSIVRKVSKGDLTPNPKYANANPNSIVGAMNYMQQKLKDVIEQINQVSIALKHQSENSETRSIDLDKLANNLSEEARVVSSTITELTASSGSVADNAQLTVNSIKETEITGKNAQSLTQEASDTIILLEKQIDSAGNNIHQLESEVANIESLLSVIKSIAEQTNLLALNAAIEASRAGDQGRGFAVVADEVRLLAQRTQTSTQEITQMLAKLQDATVEAKDSVTMSITTSNQTVARSKQVLDELSKVADSLSTMAQMSDQICTAADEQLAAGEDTAKRVVAISDSASNTAELSHKAKAATNEILELSNKLHAQLNKFEI